MKKAKVKKIKVLKGEVVSKKLKKTAVVLVTRSKSHKKYKKRYIVSKRYIAHDENDKAKVGDHVQLIPCRPISKRKKWYLKIIK